MMAMAMVLAMVIVLVMRLWEWRRGRAWHCSVTCEWYNKYRAHNY